MTSLYTVKQMTSWLSTHLEEVGFKTEVYSDKFLPARVPVYARKTMGKGKDESVEELVVDVINSQTLKRADFFYSLHIYRTIEEEGLELKDASSATFFQYYFPRAKVYWAYPDYLDKDEEFSKFKGLCQKYKVGLFEIGEGEDKKGKVVDIAISTVPLIDTIFEKFQLAISPIQKYIEKSHKDKHLIEEIKNRIYKELDHHIEETNKYLIYYPEPEYKRREISERIEGRNISLTLIDKLGEIENLSYKKYLHELGAKYRTLIEDDYAIALGLIKKLWNINGLEYPEFQKDFEPVLLLNPRYRDHFLHQLHVFLLGCYIIDKLYNDESISAFEQKFGNPIEDMWLFASSYHDYNYNIQNYDEWINTFFEKTLFLNENPSRLKLDECYVKEDYMFKTKELCEAFGLNVDKITLLFFYEKIINKKNHGLLGALSLLKLFDQNYPPKIKRESLIKAARAIALHDEDIWKHFSGKSEGDFSQKKALEKLEFKDDPLSFLLIFCDTIQEWGRVGRDYEETEARLDDVGFSDNLMWVNISVRDEDAFSDKKNEIDRVKKFLLDKRFKITLSTREGLGSNIVERFMEGE